MRVSVVEMFCPKTVGFHNSQPIKPKEEEPVEEKPTDYPYPKRPNLLKRVWNLLREKEEEDMRIVQLDYVA